MILDDIVAHKREEVERREAAVTQRELERVAASRPPALDLAAALRGHGVGLIGEIKRASPSRGALAPDLDAVETADVYIRNGAAAISVLTDERFFSGSLADLEAAKRTADASLRAVPILRKDFVVDRYQVVESRAAGADAVLLIVRILSDDEMARLGEEIEAWGMTPLVEVYDEEDIARIGALAPAVVGINHRNLADFRVDRSAFGRLRRLLPVTTVVVAASGVRSAADVARLGEKGADAVLVGEALVTSDDPASMVRALANAGRASRVERSAA